MEWKSVLDPNYRHTAATMYLADGFKVWKGRYNVFSCLYSANEWHVERIADHRVLYSSKTATQCRKALECAIKKGVNVYKEDFFGSWVLF